ncbi:MAG: phosphatase [Elusimicrobia bacterium RIFOXYC2_FULL_34_12]|nr:MAG: phosphatase [Elusimicrobia bacterium RIFOXYC2_FULL_34_12]
MKAVIFDMDGVIIDSEPMHLRVNKKIFKRLGLKISLKEYRNFIGSTNTEMWTTFKKEYELHQTIPELVKIQVSDTLKDLKKSKEKPISGIVSLLKELKKNNIRIGLASSSPLENINLVLKIFKIKKYFSAIVSGEDLKRSKPAPDIFLKAAKKLKVKPEECIVIEDSEKGVQAAKSAGMKCIGYKNKNSGNQNLSKADLIIKNFSKLDIDYFRGLFFNLTN